MRIRSLVVIFLVACGGKSPEPTPGPKPAPASNADPMAAAFEAATQYNMNLSVGGADAAKQQQLVDTTIKQLKLACEAKNACACSALETGECQCDNADQCAGQPFWFVRGN